MMMSRVTKSKAVIQKAVKGILKKIKKIKILIILKVKKKKTNKLLLEQKTINYKKNRQIENNKIKIK